MLQSEKELRNFEIRARDGTIGKVKDVYFDDREWVARYVVVDTGTWLNSRRVLLPVRRLEDVTTDRALVVNATREQVRNSPPVHWDRPVSRVEERSLHDYYGWPYYWATAPLGGIGPGIAPTTAPIPGPVPSVLRETTGHPAAAISEHGQPADDQDPHLRSADEIRGYRIEARSGRAGHVEDFLIDSARWAIRYLVVDTRDWWPGKKVLIAPGWIEGVSYPKETVAIDLTLDQIRQSPEYDASKPVDSAYAARLHDHYRRPRYDF
jgi:hypothetical protein